MCVAISLIIFSLHCMIKTSVRRGSFEALLVLKNTYETRGQETESLFSLPFFSRVSFKKMDFSFKV